MFAHVSVLLCNMHVLWSYNITEHCAGEIGRMYEANVDDVGYRLVAIYTPVREDGVEGQPISVSTEPIAVGTVRSPTLPFLVIVHLLLIPAILSGFKHYAQTASAILCRAWNLQGSETEAGWRFSQIWGDTDSNFNGLFAGILEPTIVSYLPCCYLSKCW